MIRALNFTASFFFIVVLASAQDTFSIVAADSTTGEIGSAGATCLDDRSFPGSGGAIIISDVVPGIGAVHTQSYYLAANQSNANQKLKEGLNAKEISQWLQANDAQNDKDVRQYGMLTIDQDGKITTDAFTGARCLDEKAHRIGPNYAIQGNILIGEEILDSMEARFLRTPGDLCEKMMAALQGANVRGADSRCWTEGVSSQSAFVRVAKPGDDADNLFMDLNVPVTPFRVEPIDELQTLFDAFKNQLGVNFVEAHGVEVFPNPTQGILKIHFKDREVPSSVSLVQANGRLIRHWEDISRQSSLNLDGLSSGLYMLRWQLRDGSGFYKKVILR